MDFTFKNKEILDFFEGRSKTAPTGELVYLHEHPLIRPSFITEIEALVKKTGETIARQELTGQPLIELTKLAIELGTKLPIVDYGNAEKLLLTLREIYQLCNKINT